MMVDVLAASITTKSNARVGFRFPKRRVEKYPSEMQVSKKGNQDAKDDKESKKPQNHYQGSS